MADQQPQERRDDGDRREKKDRRQYPQPDWNGPERRQNVVDRRTGLERRRGPGRRRTEFAKAAEEGEMTDEQFLFVMAIDVFKRANQKPFPSWTDVLEVIRKLGYRKTMPCELTLPNMQDWTEAPDAPAGVDAPAQDDDAEEPVGA